MLEVSLVLESLATGFGAAETAVAAGRFWPSEAAGGFAWARLSTTVAGLASAGSNPRAFANLPASPGGRYSPR